MFRINLKFAIRNILKYKAFSFINLTGLIIGISASLLMLMYVVNELSYENVHKNRDRIYRINTTFGSGESQMKLAGANAPLAPAAESQIPSVESATRFLSSGNIEISYKDKVFNESEFFYTDTSYFKIFTVKIIKGNSINPLAELHSVVITQSIADKIFGNENPIGKTLTCGENDLIVSAVAEDVPINTQMQWDYLALFSVIEHSNPSMINWQNFGNCYTYLMLKPNVSDENLDQNITDLLIKNAGAGITNYIQLHPQKFTDIYFSSQIMGELGAKGNITYVYLFSSVAVLILLIACFNFVNLSTSRSLNRGREVGIKKVLGATKISLAKQFLSESFILTIIAVVFSTIIYIIFNPILSQYLGYNIAVKSIYNIYFYLILLGVTFIAGLFSGIYPAFILTKFQPVQTLKGNLKHGSAGVSARKVLVVFQFAISIFLIAVTFSIFNQLNFMRKADLGFDKSNLVLIQFPSSDIDAESKYNLLKDELLQYPGIKSVSGVYTLPGINSREMQAIQLTEDDQENRVMRSIGVDYDFIKTLGMSMVAGRSFSKDYSTDRSNAILLNEAAVKKLGISAPVGKSIYIPGGEGKNKEVKIIGIVKNFHISSLREEIEPVFMFINPARFFNIAVKIKPNQTVETISYIKASWTNLFPDEVIDLSFMDQKYSKLYSSEEKLGVLFFIFSGLAIFVACLGLFGLSAFTAEVRRKEIGVRKVLGASVSGISIMLSKQFLVWILIANIFALPIAGYAINTWLQDFAYRITLDWTVFVISSLLVILVSILAISIQVIKAAMTNPVNSLRSE